MSMGESPFRWSDSIPVFCRPLRATLVRDRATIRDFCGDGADVAMARLCGAVERHSDRIGNR
jgi:hypothetical protein